MRVFLVLHYKEHKVAKGAGLSKMCEFLVSVCPGALVCRTSRPSGSKLAPHRRNTSLHRLLQMVVVGQNLHEEVELQSLRLQDKNSPPPTQISSAPSQ